MAVDRVGAITSKNYTFLFASQKGYYRHASESICTTVVDTHR